MCDRIAIINHGEVVACEDKPALLSRIESKTLVLRLAHPLAEPPELDRRARAELRAPDLLALTYARSRTSALALIDAARQAGLEITDITTEEPTLEQGFLSLTGGGARGPGVGALRESRKKSRA